VLTIKPTVPLILHRRSFFIALSLLLVLIGLTIQYPGPLNVADTLLQRLGIPLHSRPETRTGVHYSGIFMIAILVTCITLFNHALSRRRFIIFIAAILLLNNVPNWLVHGYQRFFASGVYALELDAQDIQCTYAWKADRFAGNCQIPITNHSGSALIVKPVIEIPQHYGEPLARGPIALPELTLLPYMSSTFNPEFDLAADSNEQSTGKGFGYTLTLDDGEHTRTWE